MRPSSVFFIPAGVPFLHTLAAGLRKESQDDPLALAQVVLYLPHKRAIAALRDIFLKENTTFFLPQMKALGDLETPEDFFDTLPLGDSQKPVISPLLRCGLLTTLVRQQQEILATQTGRPLPPLVVALQLAQELIRLLDQAAIEQVCLKKLANLVPENFAAHWQVSLNFLQIIKEHWPLLLAEKGVQDPYSSYAKQIQAVLDHWVESPPAQRIIVAGSTGTMPATAAFLKTVAQLSKGMVILPGLEPTLSPQEQKALLPSHPQYALYRLLQRLELSSQDVPVWPFVHALQRDDLEKEIAQARRSWFLQAHASSSKVPSIDPQALKGLQFVPCASLQEEALVIALMMREALETPGRTAALITPDRRLACQVKGELKRWGIVPQDTGGVPLAMTSQGALVRLMLQVLLEEFAPVPLLALLKHPLLLNGKYPFLIQRIVTLLEQQVLRGPRPRAGIAGLRAALSLALAQNRFLTLGLDFLEQSLSPLQQALEAPGGRLSDLLAAHRKAAEALCGNDFWEDEIGGRLAQFFTQFQEYASAFPPLKGDDYRNVLDILLGSTTVFSQAPTHPRLAILGTLEARLLHADVMILGSLNEGVWPPDLGGDPWLSRGMREELGLPPLERRIGLASHDFGQAFAHATVFLTRALRIEGTPTVPSRLLLRLETALNGAGHTLPHGSQWLAWAQQIDRPSAIIPCEPLAPCPPVSARPRRLSVTQIETWKRDPYALYARHILQLKPLDPLDADPTQADQGTLIHKIFENFLRQCSDIFAEEAFVLLRDIGEQVFRPFLTRPVAHAFWWARFLQIAQWFLETERERRRTLPPYKTFTEIQGKITFEGPQGLFELVARADRLDVFEDGRIDLIDYKTGAVPAEMDVILGFSPQLALEAVLLHQGGFASLKGKSLAEISFWRLCGGQRGGEIKSLKIPADQLLHETWEGIQRLVAAFDHPDTPYLAQPLPDKGLAYPVYAHLARLLEGRAEEGT